MPSAISAQPSASPDAETTRLAALMRMPVVAALAPEWRGLLASAAVEAPPEGSDAPVAAGVKPNEAEDPLSPPATLAELADTLDALSRLNAEGDVVTAAILHDTPAWAARVAPQLESHWPGVAVLLDGQRAAAQFVLLIDQYDALVGCGGFQRSINACRSRANNQQIAMRIGCRIMIRINLGRRVTKPGHVADNRFIHPIPKGPRPHKGFVVKARREKHPQPIIDRAKIGLQRRPAVLAGGL